MNKEQENSYHHSVNIMSLLIITCAPLQHNHPVHSPRWLHLLSRPSWSHAV